MMNNNNIETTGKQSKQSDKKESAKAALTCLVIAIISTLIIGGLTNLLGGMLLIAFIIPFGATFFFCVMLGDALKLPTFVTAILVLILEIVLCYFIFQITGSLEIEHI
ncbi:MAG: hypothetical protein LBJ12_04795 [Oscillospiraceae bacterium]|nr:hypothetical protein [Oscillospiraceae bacterium]